MLKKRFISVMIAAVLAFTAATFIGGNTASAAQITNIFEMLAAEDDNANDAVSSPEEVTGAAEETTGAAEETTGAAEETTGAAEETTEAAEETTSAAEEAAEDAKEKTGDAEEKADDAKEAADADESTDVTIDLGSGDVEFTGDEADKILQTLTILMIDNKELFVEDGLDLSADGKKDVEVLINTAEDGKNTLTLKKAEKCDLEEEFKLTVSEDAKKKAEILKLNSYAGTIIFQLAEPIQPVLEAAFAGSKKQPYKTSKGEETYLDTLWFYYSDMTFIQYAFLEDGMQVFSKGTYEFVDGGNFYFSGAESDYDNIIINRTHKYIDGEGLTEYESSHTYELNSLGFDRIYVSQDHIDQAKTAEKKAAESKDAAADEAAFKFVIIHTNDMHGYLEATDNCLGIAAVSQLKKDYEEKGYEVLLLDAGDAIQGNILVNNSQGETAVQLMNAIGYDAMALGNHEFDYGADVLEKRMEEFDFPVLAANVTVDATGKPFAEENTIITLKDGTKVGVLGIVTPLTETSSSPKKTAGLSFLADQDLYAAVQKQIDQLKEEGCEAIICLGHLGEDKLTDGNAAEDVVKNTRGLNLFIDGHDHMVENQAVKDLDGKEVPIVETGCFLQNIGVLSYDGDKFTEELVEAGKYEGSDKEINDKVEAISKALQDALGEKIASCSFDLNGEASPGNRTSETNFGDLITDAILWQVSQASDVKPDAAIINGGAVRASVKAGDISELNIQDVLPFNDQLYTVKVTGAQLLEALEAGTQATPDPAGAFPQVSQIKYSVDTTVEYKQGEQYPDSKYNAPAEPGSRVTITEVGGKAFDKDATYTIATTDFISSGGDTYYCFEEAAVESRNSVGYLDYEAVVNYLQDELGGTVPDTYKEPQGRITINSADTNDNN